MRTTLTIFAMLAPTLAPTLATADPGHIAEVAGHSHWVAGAAVGVAAALGLLVWGGRGKAKPEEEEAPEGAST